MLQGCRIASVGLFRASPSISPQRRVRFGRGKLGGVGRWPLPRLPSRSADSRRTADAPTRPWAHSENLVVEAFGAIHSAGEQPGDVAVMTGSTMKQRDVLVDREGRRDRRSELNQLHVLLCVVARQHVQLPIRRRRRGAQLTAATASIDRHARKRSRGSRRRYGLPETSSQLIGVVIDSCSVGRILAALRCAIHVASARRRVRCALKSTLRGAATSRSESERSGNGVAESALDDVQSTRRCRTSPRSHSSPTCRLLERIAALNSS